MDMGHILAMLLVVPIHYFSEQVVYIEASSLVSKSQGPDLSAIEKVSGNAKKLAQGHLELLNNKEECSTQSIYGQSKGKVDMDSNKRKAPGSKFIMISCNFVSFLKSLIISQQQQHSSIL